MIQDPPILILDDATASVDTRTEHLIQKALDRLMQGATASVHLVGIIREAGGRQTFENIHHQGGTILGTTNRGDPFRWRGPKEKGGQGGEDEDRLAGHLQDPGRLWDPLPVEDGLDDELDRGALGVAALRLRELGVGGADLARRRHVFAGRLGVAGAVSEQQEGVGLPGLEQPPGLAVAVERIALELGGELPRYRPIPQRLPLRPEPRVGERPQPADLAEQGGGSVAGDDLVRHLRCERVSPFERRLPAALGEQPLGLLEPLVPGGGHRLRAGRRRGEQTARGEAGQQGEHEADADSVHGEWVRVYSVHHDRPTPPPPPAPPPPPGPPPPPPPVRP